MRLSGPLVISLAGLGEFLGLVEPVQAQEYLGQVLLGVGEGAVVSGLGERRQCLPREIHAEIAAAGFEVGAGQVHQRITGQLGSEPKRGVQGFGGDIDRTAPLGAVGRHRAQ
nr:hypothetical protein [Nocardia speluncae]